MFKKYFLFIILIISNNIFSAEITNTDSVDKGIDIEVSQPIVFEPTEPPPENYKAPQFFEYVNEENQSEKIVIVREYHKNDYILYINTERKNGCGKHIIYNVEERKKKHIILTTDSTLSKYEYFSKMCSEKKQELCKLKDFSNLCEQVLIGKLIHPFQIKHIEKLCGNNLEKEILRITLSSKAEYIIYIEQHFCTGWYLDTEEGEINKLTRDEAKKIYEDVINFFGRKIVIRFNENEFQKTLTNLQALMRLQRT